MRSEAGYAWFMGKTTTAACGKCDGIGRIRAFSHIEGGKCFWCGGAGTVGLAAAEPLVLNTVDVEAFAAYHRALYLKAFASASRSLPGLTLAQFREMARVTAESLRVEDRREAIMPEHWSGAAYYVAADLANDAQAYNEACDRSRRTEGYTHSWEWTSTK